MGMQRNMAVRQDGSQFPVLVYDERFTDSGITVTLPNSTLETLERENATLTFSVKYVEKTSYQLLRD